MSQSNDQRKSWGNVLALVGITVKTVLRGALILLLCVTFGALVGVCVVATRFGIHETYFKVFFWMPLVAGGLAGFFGAILAPGWPLKRRLLLAGGGTILGSAAGAGVGYFIEHQPTLLALVVVVPLWGVLLGLWLGWLRGALVLGSIAGLLILGGIAGLGLFLGHPDPAAFLGAAGGLSAGVLLCPAEQRRRLRRTPGALAAGLFLLASVALVLIAPRLWPRMQLYRVVVRGTPPPPSPTCFSPDGKRALGRMHNGVCLWNVEDSRVLNHLPRGQGDLRVAAVCYPRDDTAYCVFLDRWGALTRWNAHTGKLDSGVLGVERHPLAPLTAWDHPHLLALSADGRRAAVIDPLEAHQLWDINFDEHLIRPVPLPDALPVTGLAWIDGERLLLGCKRDGSLHIAAFVDGTLRVLRSFPSPLAERGQLWVSPDGRHACVLNRELSPCVGNLEEVKDFQPLGGRIGLTRVATFSPDSRYLFWVDWDEVVHVWDLPAGREVRCYRQFRSLVLEKLRIVAHPLTGLAVRPDGKVAMSTRGDGQVRLWELDHEQQP
ncbi:MAG: WD40 repeat domain-containing protein [Planctomycetes bacterium]|nr:WD40 repeat domain-containing protein [Planctomycetota bacterium]